MKEVWGKVVSNEFSHLAQGNVHAITSTDTIYFIPQSTVPSNAAVTYASFVRDYQLLKTEKYRCQMVVGGDQLKYPDDLSSPPAASLLETKLLLNSTISDAHKGAIFVSCNLKYFPLQHPWIIQNT